MYTERDGHGYGDGGTYSDVRTEVPENPVEEGSREVVGAGAAEALLDELSEATRNVVRTAEEVADRVREESASTLATVRERAAEIEDEIRADVEARMNEARAEHMDQIAELRATKAHLVEEIEALHGRREDLVGEALRLADQLRSLGTPAAQTGSTEDGPDVPSTVAQLFASGTTDDTDQDLLTHAIEQDRTWGSLVD